MVAYRTAPRCVLFVPRAGTDDWCFITVFICVLYTAFCVCVFLLYAPVVTGITLPRPSLSALRTVPFVKIEKSQSPLQIPSGAKRGRRKAQAWGVESSVWAARARGAGRG